MHSCEIGIEACGGAHQWGCDLTFMVHQVKMIPVKYVKPFVKTNKNDAVDARAIVEVMGRLDMRFVEMKSTEQQSVLLVHQVRSQLIKQRTQTANAMRSHCAESGVVHHQGVCNAYEICEMIRMRAVPRIPCQAYALLSLLADQFESLGQAIGKAEAQIRAYFKRNEICQRLAAVPGD